MTDYWCPITDEWLRRLMSFVEHNRNHLWQYRLSTQKQQPITSRRHNRSGVKLSTLFVSSCLSYSSRLSSVTSNSCSRAGNLVLHCWTHNVVMVLEHYPRKVSVLRSNAYVNSQTITPAVWMPYMDLERQNNRISPCLCPYAAVSFQQCSILCWRIYKMLVCLP